MDTKVKHVEGLGSFTVKKVFFHNVKGKAWRMFLILESGDTIVMPVSPDCPIQILTEDQLRSDLEEFKVEIKKEKIESIERLSSLMSSIEGI